jgi:hypothetical protein
MKKITLVDYININTETNEPTRFEVLESEIKEMVDLRGMRIYEKDDFVKHLEMEIKNNDDLEEILKDESLYNDLDAAAYNSTLLAEWEESINADVVYNDSGTWYLDNLEDMETTCIWEYWDNGNWITRVIEDDELEIEEMEEEINVEGAIEHLQEMGKVAIGNCNVSELQEALEEKGYITEVQESDRDYLVLVEKRLLEIPGYSIVKEIEARLLDLEGQTFKDSYGNTIIIKNYELLYKEDNGELSWVNLHGKCGDAESGYDTYLDELNSLLVLSLETKITICYDDEKNVIEVYEFDEEIEDFLGINAYNFGSITYKHLDEFNWKNNDLFEKAKKILGGN